MDNKGRKRIVQSLRSQAGRIRQAVIRKGEPQGISLKELMRVFPVREGKSPDSPRRDQVISVEEYMARREREQMVKDKARMKRKPPVVPPASRRR